MRNYSHVDTYGKSGFSLDNVGVNKFKRKSIYVVSTVHKAFKVKYIVTVLDFLITTFVYHEHMRIRCIYTLLTDSNTTEKIYIHTNLQKFWRRNMFNVCISLHLTAVKIFAWKCLKYEKIDSYNNNVEIFQFSMKMRVVSSWQT